ncbi:DUF2637 domain-containing protein [Streptomyces sp. NPDC058739]|uniref:DUF2637 domain-containing protein n=1 Tax=Streptomyces sp. NPDC058739 TaxID=3346618 RepID=UPI0036B7D9E3
MRAAPARLTSVQRALAGLVVLGAAGVAGIGFAGSYAAVRELAVKKGFGDFSYVFPIGIDAGICVLLALDLLLTWIRIPLPLLRQTAWVLTAATIAFNGAAAWPDPLGTAMHAVIPILFVISVEAARHAIGRIADITADKHMEGVRLTRWLLSPLPTFLLWRRMKLWELRSYDQVIKLEQERLVYQARLRSRYGRSWRRKAPVESLMPLRLARYGVPLTQTTAAAGPAGPAAAGIEPTTVPQRSQQPRPSVYPSSTTPASVTRQGDEPALARDTATRPDLPPAAHPQQRIHRRNQTLASAIQDELATTSRQDKTGERKPPTEGSAAASHTHFGDRPPRQGRPGPAGPRDRAAALPARNLPASDAAGGAAPEAGTARTHSSLTTVDRYYLAWNKYRAEHGEEPSAERLSGILSDQGLRSRAGGKPVSPSTLRRYLLPFRVYHLWAGQRRGGPAPSPDAIARRCAVQGITAQHQKPLSADYIAGQSADFERRWQALSLYGSARPTTPTGSDCSPRAPAE